MVSGPADEGERVRQLDVYTSSGPGDIREWHVRCRTCGWELRGVGDTAPRNEAAKSHRCQSKNSRR